MTDQAHNCPMAPTYATVDASTYCGHPSHDGPVNPDYSEYWGADICGNCGIPVDRHGGNCGEWADVSESAAPARQAITREDTHD